MQPSTATNQNAKNFFNTEDFSCKPAAELTSELSYSIQSACSTQQNDYYIETFGTQQKTCQLDLKAALNQVRQGFESGVEPKLTAEGTSGTYELQNAQREKLAIFKPIDEEPYAPNNPRGLKAAFGNQTCRPGVLSGESTVREVAAYLLDHDGFSGVPATTMVEVNHPCFDRLDVCEQQVTSEDYFDQVHYMLNSQQQQVSLDQQSLDFDSNVSDLEEIQEINASSKIGSLQNFVRSEGPIENFSEDLFSADEVHKIAVLDIRMFNLDRNVCNILVQNEQVDGQTVRKLVPIDHGLTIPETLEVCSYDLAWLSFSQASQSFSKKTLEYIESLDIMGDIEMLEKTFKFRSICLRNMRISSLLLKMAAKSGMTLEQIGQIMCRPDEDDTQLSQLELLVEQARSLTDSEKKSSTKKGLAGVKRVRSLSDMIYQQQSGSSASSSDCQLDLSSLDGQKHAEIDELDLTSGNQTTFQNKQIFGSDDASEYIWNGPHDEPFFENFTVLLEKLISNLQQKLAF